MGKATQNIIESWDPLESGSDPGMIQAAQRREIRNILKSYTGYYDLFAELLQNALDAVERRIGEGDEAYTPAVWISIDIQDGTVAVTDNGCGMDEDQFKQFLRPNFSFKEGETTRGSKGVGATYLAYGFNYLEVATKHDSKTFSGVMKRGREWVEDRTESIHRPKVEPQAPTHKPFLELDRGASMVVKLLGESIRPRDLSWIGADDSETWIAILRTTTPLGGVYLCDSAINSIKISLDVTSADGTNSTAEIDRPLYLHPESVISRVADIRKYLAVQKQKVDKGQDVSKTPAKFRN